MPPDLIPVEGNPFAQSAPNLIPVDGNPFADQTLVPEALTARFEAGAQATKREGGLAQTIPQFVGLIGTPEGRTKLWDAVKQYPEEFAKGMIGTLKVPGDVAAGNIDLNTSEGIDKAIGLGALVGLGRLNKLPLNGQTAGAALVVGEPMARIDRGPMGEIQHQVVGALPQPEEFANAAKIVSPDSTTATEKLTTLYNEHGIHPAEVVHDAQHDVTVSQAMVSDTPVLPERYADAQNRILDKVSVGDSDPAKKLTWNHLYTQAIDDLHPIKKAVDEATGGEKLPVSEDPYKLARLTRGNFGRADAFLNHGAYDFNTYETTGPGLKAILEPAQGDLDGLRAYLVSKRAIEIEQSKRNSGMDLAAAQKVVEDGAAKFEPIAEKLDAYQDTLAKHLRDSGVLSADSYDAMRQANKEYVPFQRVMGDDAGGFNIGKGFGPGDPIKRLEGSSRDVIDPLESIIRNTFGYISIAERNAAGIKLIDTLRNAGSDALHLIEPTDTTSEHIGAFRNGIKESYAVSDPDLLTAFKGLDQQTVSMLTKVLAVPAKSLRAGAVLTPEFAAKNIVRDFMTAFINSKGLFSPADTLRGLKSAVAKDGDFENWLKSGGANSAMVALDREYLQHNIEQLTAKTGIGTRAWNVAKSPLEILRIVSELAENSTRLGEFKKVLGDSTAKADIQEAGYASREVTLDFARIGASTRAANMLIAFFNAQIQGVDRLGRAFIDNPVKTPTRIAAAITLPSVLLWWANHDDERYKNAPAWEKDLFWLVMTKDHVYRIPKLFEAGIIFGTGAERTLEHFFGDNPDAFKGFGGSVASAFAPSIIPTFALPLLEQFANRSTFTDRTLIPHNMEKFLPEYQYTPYTTEAAKALGRIVGAFPGISNEKMESTPLGGVARAMTSPILIENYIRAWTGGLGTYALQAADASLRKSGVLPDPPQPAATLSDIPFIKAFVVRYPSASAQPIQDFYDEFAKQEKYFATWSAKAHDGDAVAMDQIQKAGGPGMFMQLSGVKQTLAEHSQLVRDVFKDPSMKPEEKRQLIDQLYYSMIQISQDGNRALRAASTIGKN